MKTKKDIKKLESIEDFLLEVRRGRVRKGDIVAVCQGVGFPELVIYTTKSTDTCAMTLADRKGIGGEESAVLQRVYRRFEGVEDVPFIQGVHRGYNEYYRQLKKAGLVD